MGDRAGHPFTASFWIALGPDEAFDTICAELSDALGRSGISAVLAREGTAVEGGTQVGTVATWERGRVVSFRWRPAPWSPEGSVEITVAFDPAEDGTLVTTTVEGWEEILGDRGSELAGWGAAKILTPIFHALSPSEFGDWLTDRRARRPFGPQARDTYQNPEYHWPNFLLILERIRLAPQDSLLEVGCGGGAFLHRALESGCTAIAVDHSPDMVRLAREVNRDAVAAGRLEVLEGEAERLPVEDGRFTWAVMTGVFGFVPDPPATLRELRRALVPEGHIALFLSTAALRGTIAAPEPMASRIHFYEANEARELVEREGFDEVEVTHPALEAYARRAGLTEDQVEIFKGTEGSLLLVARKPPSA